MAAEFVELMAALGHERFAVVGHDRGAWVAYRLALDHPGRVTRVAVLNIVPTVEQFDRHDVDDRTAGRHISAPRLVVTGADETALAAAPDVWQGWADDVTATQVPGGHFVPEEAPRELTEILAAFLDPDR
jgi:haloacetate dehalogenase